MREHSGESRKVLDFRQHLVCCDEVGDGEVRDELLQKASGEGSLEKNTVSEPI